MKAAGKDNRPFRRPDGTLVRDGRKRIYIIKGKFKQVIRNLDELRKYRGRPIYDLADSDLAEYPACRFYDRELIREKGGKEIYALCQGKSAISRAWPS